MRRIELTLLQRASIARLRAAGQPTIADEALAHWTLGKRVEGDSIMAVRDLELRRDYERANGLAAWITAEPLSARSTDGVSESQRPGTLRGRLTVLPPVDERGLWPGIFYAQGVKANVLFFDRRPASDQPQTTKLWVYDLRTNQHFTLKTKPLQRSDLDDFVRCYHPTNRRERRATWHDEESPTGRWRAYDYSDLVARDKASLDVFWVKDEALEASANLPAPELIAAEIVEDLRAALSTFEELQGALAER